MLFTLILKNEKRRNYLVISQLLVFFNLLGFIFLLLNNEESISKHILLMAGVLATAAYSFLAIQNKLLKKTIPLPWHRMVFLFCSVVWISEAYWWLSLVIALFVLFDLLVHRTLKVIVSDKSITLPSIPAKKVKWHELNNVILKDDLLTIDFKNNKLFQQLINDQETDINENTFNAGCRELLNTGSSA